jgi:hypothetical protein
MAIAVAIGVAVSVTVALFSRCGEIEQSGTEPSMPL